MTPTVTDWVQAGAAILTMLAAFVAAYVAARAPKLAAEYAETYRRKTAEADEARAFQLMVFRALMKGRAEIMAQDTRAAINLVEAAFPKCPGVRSARRMFTKSATAQPFSSESMVVSYLDLVLKVACAVGYEADIDRFDVESGYYPTALGLLDEAALAEAMRRIADHGSDVARVPVAPAQAGT